MKLLSLAIFIMLSLASMAQSAYSDQVYLSNGSILRCKIVDFKTEGQIKLEIQGGSILVYNSCEITKVERAVNNKPEEVKKEGHSFSKEIYFSAYFGIIGGYIERLSWFGNFDDVPTLGCGYKLSAGKALNRHVMIGAGAGWSYMNNFFMYSAHFPVFAEVRGDLIKKSNSLYYSFALGYNIAKLRTAMSWTGVTMTEARGGVYMNPALGLRFASKNKKHFCLELNYGIHTASYSYSGTNGEQIGPTRNVFIRPTLSFGMLF